MVGTSIAPPKDLQLESALVALPAEVKHHIFKFCFATDRIISDPTIQTKSEEDPSPSLGVGLLQTCRRLYHEVDRRPLFSQNTFQFTTVNKAEAFLHALDEHCRSSVHDISIDIRMSHSDRIAHEWTQYLAWGGDMLKKDQNSLKTDAPNLKTLRLNFESWPKIPMFRTELWYFLRQLLSNVRGLERIVVVGASKGQAMARRDPWSTAHFIGADDVACNNLIPQMWRCVEASDNAKVIRWVRESGKLYLEVVSKAHLSKNLDSNWREQSVKKSDDNTLPVNGNCSWTEYESHVLNVNDSMIKSLSPNAAG
jgi:hypothetical protein